MEFWSLEGRAFFSLMDDGALGRVLARVFLLLQSFREFKCFFLSFEQAPFF